MSGNVVAREVVAVLIVFPLMPNSQTCGESHDLDDEALHALLHEAGSGAWGWMWGCWIAPDDHPDATHPA